MKQLILTKAEAVARALKDYPSESTRFFLLDEDECATHKVIAIVVSFTRPQFFCRHAWTHVPMYW